MCLFRESSVSVGFRGGSTSCIMMHSRQLAHLPLQSRLLRSVLPGSKQEDTSKAVTVSVSDTGRSRSTYCSILPKGCKKKCLCSKAAFSELISWRVDSDVLSRGWITNWVKQTAPGLLDLNWFLVVYWKNWSMHHTDVKALRWILLYYWILRLCSEGIAQHFET